jgi:hypothetical protein
VVECNLRCASSFHHICYVGWCFSIALPQPICYDMNALICIYTIILQYPTKACFKYVFVSPMLPKHYRLYLFENIEQISVYVYNTMSSRAVLAVIYLEVTGTTKRCSCVWL